MKEIFKLDMKLLKSSRTVLLSAFLSLALFFLLAGGMLTKAEEASRVPVGVLDLDQSRRSSAFTGRLAASEALSVRQGTRGELERLLREEKIAAYFTIGKGFEPAALKGQPGKSLTFTYLSGQESAGAVMDIAAGVLMFDVCLGKGSAVYRSLGSGGKIVSEEEYRSYAESLYEEGENRYGFEVEMISPQGKAAEKEPGNSLLYKQAVIGLLGMVLGFFLLFAVGCICRDSEAAAGLRLRLTGIHAAGLYGGHGLAVLSLNLLFCAAAGLLLLFTGQAGEAGTAGTLLFLLSLFAAGVGYFVLLILLRMLFRSETAWQLAGSLFLALSGAIGLAGLFVKDLLILSEFMPNYWCIRAFTAIMVK